MTASDADGPRIDRGTVWPGVRVAGWAHGDGVDPRTPDMGEPKDELAPSADVFIQWKGTEVCLDFHCRCGRGAHVCGQTHVYSIRCSGCGRTFVLPHTVQVAEVVE